MSSLHNQSVEQIIAQIEETKVDTDDKVRDVCLMLNELVRRRVGHRLLKHPIFRWYREIASGKLLPGLVVHSNGNSWLLKRLIGANEGVQRAVMNGIDLTVADVDGAGVITEARKPFDRMSRATIARLFPGDGQVATFSEQRDAIRREMESRKPAPPRVRADLEKRTIIVGNSVVALAELKAALADLGLTIAARETADA